MSRVCFCGRPLTWRDLIRSVKNNFVSPAAYLNTHQLGAHSGLVNSSKKGTCPIAAASCQLGLMCTMYWLDGHWAQQGISDSISLMTYAKTCTFCKHLKCWSRDFVCTLPESPQNSALHNHFSPAGVRNSMITKWRGHDTTTVFLAAYWVIE